MDSSFPDDSIYFAKIPVFNANSEDPNQASVSVASGLGLYNLPGSFQWDARY